MSSNTVHHPLLSFFPPEFFKTFFLRYIKLSFVIFEKKVLLFLYAKKKIHQCNTTDYKNIIIQMKNKTFQH